MPRILGVNDGWESRVRPHDQLPLPARVLLIGRSQLAGKSTFLLNLMMRPEFWGKQFEPEDVFVVSPSFGVDPKLDLLKRQLGIPEANTTKQYTEAWIRAIYGLVRERSEKNTKRHFCLILDDCSGAGNLVAHHNGALSEIFTAGRHVSLSVVCTSQKYSQVSCVMRENATQVVLWACSDKQADLAADDFSYGVTRQQFKAMLRTATRPKHGFMLINLAKAPLIYWDSDFKQIQP